MQRDLAVVGHAVVTRRVGGPAKPGWSELLAAALVGFKAFILLPRFWHVVVAWLPWPPILTVPDNL